MKVVESMNIKDVTKIIEDKYNSGKYIEFNFKVSMNINEIPTMVFDTTEYVIPSNKITDDE